MQNDTLLTAEHVHERYSLSPATLLRWIRLGRVRPHRVRLGLGEVGSNWRFAAADVAAAVERSVYEEPGAGRDDWMKG